MTIISALTDADMATLHRNVMSQQDAQGKYDIATDSCIQVLSDAGIRPDWVDSDQLAMIQTIMEAGYMAAVRDMETGQVTL